MIEAGRAAELASSCGDSQVPVTTGGIGPFRMVEQTIELRRCLLGPVEPPLHVRVHRLVRRPVDESRPIAGVELPQHDHLAAQFEGSTGAPDHEVKSVTRC